MGFEWARATMRMGLMGLASLESSTSELKGESVHDPVEGERGWRSIVLFLLSLTAVGLSLALARPFLAAIVWAIALAVATRKPYVWLLHRVKQPTVSAVLVLLAVILLLLGPMFFLLQDLGGQIFGLVSLFQSGAAQDWFSNTVDNYPRVGHLLHRISGVVSLRQATQAGAGLLAGWLRGLVSGSITVATQLVLMLFTLFFLLRDGEKAERALRSLLPMSDWHAGELMARMSDSISASVQGSLTISEIQGTLGGVMFWILGVPNALIWGVVMAVLATVPSLGTFCVWMPVAVYLAVTGHVVKAAILAGWGMFVIGTVDNLLYPTLVGSKLRMHTVPVLFAVLGGIGLFGITGIVLGPLILTITMTLLRFWSPKVLAGDKAG